MNITKFNYVIIKFENILNFSYLTIETEIGTTKFNFMENLKKDEDGYVKLDTVNMKPSEVLAYEHGCLELFIMEELKARVKKLGALNMYSFHAKKNC